MGRGGRAESVSRAGAKLRAALNVQNQVTAGKGGTIRVKVSKLFRARAIEGRGHCWHFAELDHAAAVGSVCENTSPLDQVL